MSSGKRATKYRESFKERKIIKKTPDALSVCITLALDLESSAECLYYFFFRNI